MCFCFFFQAEDGIRDAQESRGLGDVYKRQEYGDAPRAFKNNEIPVFWACGVTPQSVLENSKPDFCITHSPGKMLITDKLNNDLAAL